MSNAVPEQAVEMLRAGLDQLLAAIHANDPKRELLVRVGDLMREAAALPHTGQPQEGHVLVPEAALKWLYGEGPDADGKWFGDCEDYETSGGVRRPYWWRTKFRKMISAAPGVWIRDANGIFDTETAQRLLAGELPEVTVTLEKQRQQKTDYHGKLISISKPYVAEKRGEP